MKTKFKSPTLLAALVAASGLVGLRFAVAGEDGAKAFVNAGPTSPTILGDLPLASKLIGADMKVSVNGAGAHYRDLDSNEDITDVDVGGARANGGQMRPDKSGKSWEITLGGPVEDDYDDSFTAACKPGAIVTILSISGLDEAEVAAAGPWYVKPRSLRYAKGEAVIERITIKASYGGMPIPTGVTPSYPDPSTLT